MRRINRRLVLLSIVLVCDVVSVLGRPQEQSSASSTLKGEIKNIYEHSMWTTNVCEVKYFDEQSKNNQNV